MKFSDIVDQATALIQRKGRVSYRALKLEFELDDDQLEALIEELLFAEDDIEEVGERGLAWTGSKTQAQTESDQSDESEATITADSYPAEAERRQLTVMFCDIVDSTDLADKLDPEELREIINAYQRTSAEVIESFDGNIAQYLGDGLLVYFGYPRAHEDDAERAVRAGLGIMNALDALNSSLSHPIEARIGLHTGQVVVGEMGGGRRHEQLALGDTPNIAARIQATAKPNTIIISSATEQLVQGLFATESLGKSSLKGIHTPIELHAVSGETEAHTRFEAAVKTGLTPMIGREEEVRLLERGWDKVNEGNGQIVLITGEPGIGKSRMVQVLKERVLTEQTPRIEYRCSPHFQRTALHPIIVHLERLLGFARGDLPSARLETLNKKLSGYDFPSRDTLPILSRLLSLPLPSDCKPLDISPDQLKRRTFETLIAWILEDAERTAVYCAFEDLQWADPSTLDLLELFLDQVPTTRLLVVLTFRPDFRPPWELRSHFSHITLSRLGRSEVESIVDKVTGGKPLPDEVIEQIVIKTDGVPLFVEELTKMVIGSGLVKTIGDRYELSGPLPPLAIPSTLQDSLMARLDSLASARELAQLGAAVGREFSYDLIHAVSSLSEIDLRQALGQLVDAELIYCRGIPPQARYQFKHALIQDTAYQSLLSAQRQQFHKHIAEVLEEQFPELVEKHPELIAHHYTEAGLAERAIEYWQSAGERAVQRSAHHEAVGHLSAALEQLQKLPPSVERNRKELALQVALGTPIVVTVGWGSENAGKVYRRALELCNDVGETPQLFPTLYGLWSYYNMRAEYSTAQQTAEKLLSQAEATTDAGARLEAHVANSFSGLWLGDFALAREHSARASALYDPEQHREHVHLYRRDPGMANLAIVGWALSPLGHVEQAFSCVNNALAMALESGHPYSEAYGYAFVCLIHQFRGEVIETDQYATALLTVATENGFPFWLGWGATLRGWALAKQGDIAEGLEVLRGGLQQYQDTGAQMGRSYMLALLAEVYGAAGEFNDALATIDEALAFVEATGEGFYEAELYRLRATLMLGSGGSPGDLHAGAEVSLQKALEIARARDAKSWELRAAADLSRLWAAQGKQSEARGLLAPIYEWFTEGLDTKDLLAAATLLRDLQ